MNKDIKQLAMLLCGTVTIIAVLMGSHESVPSVQAYAIMSLALLSFAVMILIVASKDKDDENGM